MWFYKISSFCTSLLYTALLLCGLGLEQRAIVKHCYEKSFKWLHLFPWQTLPRTGGSDLGVRGHQVENGKRESAGASILFFSFPTFPSHFHYPCSPASKLAAYIVKAQKHTRGFLRLGERRYNLVLICNAGTCFQ